MPALVHVDRIITLAQIERQLFEHGKAGAVYYSNKSCWWTHHRGHTWVEVPGQPSVQRCPAGGLIFMERDWEGWLEAAKDNPAHYGRHGLNAFVAAHHANCRRGGDGKPFASARWGDYNDALDALLEEERGHG